MATLHFTTSLGDHYIVNEKGQIGTLYKHHTVKPGAGWLFLGIAHTGPGFRWGKLAATFDQLTPAVVKATQWRYRTTGTPRFTVIDLDHGTRRIWGGRKQGIRSMWYEDADLTPAERAREAKVKRVQDAAAIALEQ